MPFWAYMLHCRDRTFYVGHTDDLDARIPQHQLGTHGYTARKRPVTLVWSQEFPTRYEALEAERRIKGWRREKKLALIRGDWDAISRLAKGKGRPSTSSGRTGEGAVSTPLPSKDQSKVSVQLFRHADSRSQNVIGVAATVQCLHQAIQLRFRIAGDIAALALPARADCVRSDGLWRHTCLEAFLRFDDGSYLEFNFSPSTDWAAYAFSAYRANMTDLPVGQPRIRVRREKFAFQLNADVAFARSDQGAFLNLASVIEEIDGAKSYWALAHPPSGPPDFHDPACFVLELPPAPAA